MDASVEAGEEVAQILHSVTNPEPTTSTPTPSRGKTESSATNPPTDLIRRKAAPSPSPVHSRNHPPTPSSRFQPNGLQFPPGALPKAEKFLSQCTGCSECVYNCPYGSLITVFDQESGKNIPYIDVNSNPCHICDSFPCITACQYKALKPLLGKNFLDLGKAKLQFEYCINSQTGEKTCQACKDACPIEKTVVFRKNRPVLAKSCTGCGLCVAVCPTFPRAIRVM